MYKNFKDISLMSLSFQKKLNEDWRRYLRLYNYSIKDLLKIDKLAKDSPQNDHSIICFYYVCIKIIKPFSSASLAQSHRTETASQK